jgi:hypothetical protein
VQYGYRKGAARWKKVIFVYAKAFGRADSKAFISYGRKKSLFKIPSVTSMIIEKAI